MRMIVLLALASVMIPFHAAGEDTLTWKSQEPTCYTIIRQFGMERQISGYATIHRSADGILYRRDCDFLNHPDAAMSDIGMPLRYEDAVNTGGIHEAKHAKFLKNGMLKLY